MPATVADKVIIEGLRTRIAAVERHGQPSSKAAVLPFGLEAIDGRLPWGGLPLGAVHELHAAGADVEVGAAPAVFAAGVLARRPGPVVWVGHRHGVFVHGLLQAGLDPCRIMFVDAGKAVLLAMEEALRHPEVAGVVCELEGGLDLVASRRLQLAAEGSDVLGLLIRRSRRFDDPALRQPSAAVTALARRHPVVPAPSGARPRAARPAPARVAAGPLALPRRRTRILDRGELRCAGSSRYGCRTGRPTGCVGTTPGSRRLTLLSSPAPTTGAAWSSPQPAGRPEPWACGQECPWHTRRPWCRASRWRTPGRARTRRP